MATRVAPAAAAAGTEARVDQAGEVRLARLESLRALAALGVLAGHVWGQAHHFGAGAQSTLPARVIYGGGFGVYVFFALSGYLLYRPLAEATLRGSARIDLRRYAINRAVRILPLYYAVVAILLVVQEGGGTPGQWWRFGLLAENLFSSTALTVDGPLWSLIVEIHFYVLLPFVALLVARIARGSVTRAAAVLLVAGLAGALLRIWLVERHHGSDPRVTYSIVTTGFFFVPGMLLALARVGGLRPRGSADAWLLASLPVWLVIFDRYDLTPLAAVASMLVVGACVLPLQPGPLVRALDLRPLALLGVASYSLYLWHLPIVRALDGHGLLLASIPVSIVVALVSYRVIEAPFLRLRRRWVSA
jgi:peptidoglycan/LPS O-acetylase OafA/YrhL